MPDAKGSRAVLIGVHRYDTLDDLPAVEQNLTGLRDVFTDPALWGLAERNCLLVRQPASARTILDTLRKAATEATDALIVYFAGHGLTDPYTDELCLALPDTDPAHSYTALRYEDVRRVVMHAGGGAHRKVVVLDCCYSGRALVGGMSATEQVADQAVVDGTYLLTASAETRKALAPPGEPYTAFTGELIHTLAEGVPGGPALLDMETVYRRLHVRLTARSRPVPQQRNRNAGGSIALVRNAVRPADPEPSSSRLVLPSRHPLEDVHEGVTQLASQIARTLGPTGGLVRYTAPDGTRRTTADPAVLCQAPAEPRTDAELGADLIRRLVRRMRTEHSDGAATAAVMADAMIGTALRIVRTDATPPARLRADLAEFGGQAVWLLRSGAIEIASREQLQQVMTAATGDPDGAAALAEAADKVGKEGTVFVEERERPGLDLEVHEGMFLPADPGDHGPPAVLTFIEPYLLVRMEEPPPTVWQTLAEQEESAVVLTPAADGGILLQTTGEHRWTQRLVSAHPLGTLDDLALLIGAELQRGNPVVVPKIKIDASGVQIHHEYRGDMDQILQRVTELRAAAAAAPTAAQRAGIRLRMAQIAAGVAVIRTGPAPGEPEDVFRMRLDVLSRARDAMPALIDQGFMAGGGAVLRDLATYFVGGDPSPATTVLFKGLSEPFARFAADCGLTLDRADAAIAAVTDANGLDVRTGRPVAMAEAGIIDSVAVLVGAVTGAIATTREFLALA
nr:caspase family protein [Actinomadura bangladeshensis]